MSDANRVDRHVVATNNVVLGTNSSQVYSVSVYNGGASDVYLLVFDSSTNQLANARPSAPAVKVLAGTTGGWDFGAGGAQFYYGVNAAISTTPYTLTNATAVGDFICVRRQRR